MTPERWRRIEEIFYAAVEREPAERMGFLGQACEGDSDLRKNVQTLLNANDRPGAFLEPEALEAARAMAASLQQSRIGRQIGPYEVLSLLGAGGMGEVYRASDGRLGRKVAIKVLPTEFSQNAERLRRFEQEALAAGMLSHPNVLIVHDVGVHEDTPYIVSELLEGETLRKRLARGVLPVRQGVDYALQVARGLAAAHEKGVIHRDLKPENLFVTKEGHIKILDFGLAKLKHRLFGGVDTDAPNTPATETGMVLGTVGYMSPEQARGQDADHRSDIFSFGVILHEILTGTRAFQGASDVEVLHAILKHDPPEVPETQRRWSSGLERILRRCLEKDPRSRFQSANDLGFAIEALAPASDDSGAPRMHWPASMRPTVRKRTMPLAWIALAVVLLIALGIGLFMHQQARGLPIDSVAVLPLVNDSDNPDASALSDGITEDVINRLSQVRMLKVISRTTAFRYKGKITDPLLIGRELGVRAIVTGRLAQRGDALNIQAELVDVGTGGQLWGQSYPRKLDDILAMKDDIVTRILAGLRLQLSAVEQQRVTKRYTENPE